MKKKGFLSRLLFFLKVSWKKAARAIISSIFGKQGYLLFGIPTGLTHEMEGEKRDLSFFDQVEYRNPCTLQKPLHFAFRAASSVSASGYYVLKKGMATSLGGQLTSSNRLVTTFLQLIKKRKAHEHELFMLSSKRISPRIYQFEGRVATLAASWQSEFYHWMHEVLPRLAIYRQEKLPIDRFYVECKTAFQRESLALLGLTKEQIIDASAYEAVSAKEIYASSLPTKPTLWGCQFLKEAMAPHLQKKPNAPKKVYISRQDAPRRKVINEEELFSLLKQHGFERVILTKLSFQEQMNVFYNAEVIVAPHGAGLSHLVFAESKCKVLEFFAPPYVIPCYWQLANVMGQEYHYLFSEEREDPRPSDPDLYLDLSKVEKALQEIL